MDLLKDVPLEMRTSAGRSQVSKAVKTMTTSIVWMQKRAENHWKFKGNQSTRGKNKTEKKKRDVYMFVGGKGEFSIHSVAREHFYSP